VSAQRVFVDPTSQLSARVFVRYARQSLLCSAFVIMSRVVLTQAIVQAVSTHHPKVAITQAAANSIVDAVTGAIVHSLRTAGSFSLSGFGTFRVVYVSLVHPSLFAWIGRAVLAVRGTRVKCRLAHIRFPPAFVSSPFHDQPV